MFHSIKTGSISPQYHVVFDDCFPMAVAEVEEPQVWEHLFAYHNQTWDQLDKNSDITEPSRFEREKLEMQRKQTRNLEMKTMMVTVMEMEMSIEKRKVSPHILEISTKKRVAKPHLMKVMAMAMVMEFCKVGASKGAPIG